MKKRGLRVRRKPDLRNATLLIGLSGWMDSGNVSTGVMQYLVEKFDAKKLAEIAPEDFYVYSMPGSMETSAMVRPYTRIENGRIVDYAPPESHFFFDLERQIILFEGREPNMRWSKYTECIFALCERFTVSRIFFIGSVSGVVPHTREPRFSYTASDRSLRSGLSKLGLSPTEYEGPGSFASYLITQAQKRRISMANLVAEVPAYVQGYNPRAIITAVRLIARLIHFHIRLDELLEAASEFDKKIGELSDQQPELSDKIKELEKDYDKEAFERDIASISRGAHK
jgi:predicted ATP-grasp superfamily ATP-dependent carboligase